MGYRDLGFSEVKVCGPACHVSPFPVLYVAFLVALPVGKGNKKGNIEQKGNGGGAPGGSGSDRKRP